ncbi:MAG: site-specific integrase [Candidatus Nanopelagicales bacterium]
MRDHRRKDGQPLAASTVRGVYVAAVRALDLAADEGLTEGNPLRQVDRPTVTKATVPVTSADDADALLAACQGRRVEHLAVFVAFTGVRIGEALALRWSDVDLSAGTATIRRGSPDRDATKSGRVRTITCIPEVVDALRAQTTAAAQRCGGPRSELGQPRWSGVHLDHRPGAGPTQRHP